MAMVNPQTLRDLRARDGLPPVEGQFMPLQAPRRKRKWFFAFLFVLLMVWVFWPRPKQKGLLSEVAAAPPAVPSRVVRSPVAERNLLGIPTTAPPVPWPVLQWCVGSRCGVTIDGVSYVANSGDSFGEFHFGLFGSNWADVSNGKVSRRLHLSLPQTAGVLSGFRNRSGLGDSPHPSSGAVGGALSAGRGPS